MGEGAGEGVIALCVLAFLESRFFVTLGTRLPLYKIRVSLSYFIDSESCTQGSSLQVPTKNGQKRRRRN